MTRLKTLPARAADEGAPLPLHALTYPEHGPTGWMFIALFCAAGTASVLSAPLLAITEGDVEILAATPFGIGFGAMAFWMAYEFYRFACWTWWFVFFWLTPPLSSVFLLPWMINGRAADLTATLCIAAVAAGPAHYLWRRRDDFWYESDAVRRQLDFERNGHRWARRSWKDDARALKQRMAEREAFRRPSSATRDRSSMAATAGSPGMDADEPLRGAGRAG